MLLSTLISTLSEVKTENFKELEIGSITADSRRAAGGSIFVAIEGKRLDGADYIPDAYERGTRVFVLKKRKKKLPDSVYIYSKNPRKTLAELCCRFCDNPERKLICVGITGTKGKTTTSVVLSKILDCIGVKNIVIGTLSNHPSGTGALHNTTPDPTVIFPALRNARADGAEVAIIEVSSQALKDYRVFKIPFYCVAFTGIGRDHIGDFEHPTFADYVFSKRKLFTDYGAACAVVNFDDPYSSYMSSGLSRVVRCGFSTGGELVIANFSDTPTGAEFKLGSTTVKTSLPGEYNARNIAMAIAIAREVSGVSVSEAARYVSGIKVDGRFERRVVNGKNVIVDYAHNSDSFKEVIGLSKRLFGGRIICVFGSVGDRSFSRRAELAHSAEEYADLSVITSDNPGREMPLSVCADIYSAFRDKTKAKIITDRECAIYYAVGEAAVGDTVLLLGRGHERVMCVGGVDIPFSDSLTVEKMFFPKS